MGQPATAITHCTAAWTEHSVHVVQQDSDVRGAKCFLLAQYMVVMCRDSKTFGSFGAVYSSLGGWDTSNLCCCVLCYVFDQRLLQLWGHYMILYILIPYGCFPMQGRATFSYPFSITIILIWLCQEVHGNAVGV